jgi:uncharacterized membrane protein YczE
MKYEFKIDLGECLKKLGEYLKKLGEYLKKKWKNILLMLVAVFIMGVGVAVLKITGLGPDPCSALHYAMAEVTGLSFGTYQLCINAVLFLFLLFRDRSLFGPGTFGNMILVGYSADFTSWIISLIFGRDFKIESLPVAIAVMVPALAIFVVAAAVYMNSDTGTSPYDAFSFHIHKTLEKKTGKKIAFKLVRISYDLAVTVLAVIVCLAAKIDMTVGAVTVIMVFALGPVIDLVGKIMFPKKTADSETQNTKI